MAQGTVKVGICCHYVAQGPIKVGIWSYFMAQVLMKCGIGNIVVAAWFEIKFSIISVLSTVQVSLNSCSTKFPLSHAIW